MTANLRTQPYLFYLYIHNHNCINFNECNRNIISNLISKLLRFTSAVRQQQQQHQTLSIQLVYCCIDYVSTQLHAQLRVQVGHHQQRCRRHCISPSLAVSSLYVFARPLRSRSFEATNSQSIIDHRYSMLVMLNQHTTHHHIQIYK